MKILFFSAEFPPETGGGGIGSYVASVVHPLSERGHEVHVLSCVPGQSTSDRLIEGVWIHRRGVLGDKNIWAWAQILNGWSYLPRVYTSLSCFVQARRLGIHFDVVEAPDWMAEGLLVGLLRTHPLVGHLHTGIGITAEHNGGPFDRDGTWADRLEKRAIARSHVVTSPSEMLIWKLRTMGWLGRNPVEIVRYPLDFNKWADVSPVEDTEPIVLAVGRLEPRKAPEVVIRALGHLVRDIEGLRAVFVGDTERPHGDETYGSWLMSLAEEEGVACDLTGKIPRDELVALYQAARVIAVASTFDNFPMAALEGMAAARPIVCTSATGTAELVRGSSAGEVVAPNDVDGLAEALRPFLVDSTAAGKAGREARRLVMEHCSPNLIAEVREGVYQRAIDGWNRSLVGRLRKLFRRPS